MKQPASVTTNRSFHTYAFPGNQQDRAPPHYLINFLWYSAFLHLIFTFYVVITYPIVLNMDRKIDIHYFLFYICPIKALIREKDAEKAKYEI